MPDEAADGPVIAVAAKPADSLRGKVFHGGAMLMGRQLVSMALSLVGLLVITRIIGPAAYGPYVAALGICMYAQNLGQAGIGVYLVRAADAPSKHTYDTATTLLLISACFLVLCIEGGMGLITTWIPMPGLGRLLSVLMLSVVLQTFTVAASAKLERTLDFRRIAMIETAGQLLYYGSALPLVFMGFGVWSLVTGYTLQQLLLCIAFHVAARYRPRLAWDRTIIRSMLSYTFGYAASDWLWQLRGLVNPVIVGHFLPAEAVGQIGLAIRMLELLSFTKTVAYRLSVAVLAKVQDQPAKLVAAATDGMRLQTLALGPVLIGFSWFGGFLLSLVFGKRWEPVMTVYPFLALSYLTNAQFNIHSSILYVLRRNWDVSWFHIVHIVLFAGAAWFMVGRYGLVGYGYAEAVALLSYPVIHASVARVVGSPQYGMSALWWAAVAIGLFWRDLGPWDIAVPIVAILCPPSLRQLKVYFEMITNRRLRVA
ncbi:MAG TPA: oligosaccharide flippase family protein [Rhodopila sp.]|nr:oligosaccharide flippase family protein [Rhodopila sp.]